MTASFWQQVREDLADPLPVSKNGYEYIITCCCYFNKWSETVPLKDKSASSIANALFKKEQLQFLSIIKGLSPYIVLKII